MTLPTDLDLPFPSRISPSQPVEKYLGDLIYALEDIYQKIASNVNGQFRNNGNTDISTQWIPTLNGTTPGTFTYDHQYGWSWRSGIMTDVWFDVSWSATTASGSVYIELPYLVTSSDGIPFVGEVQASGITFPAGTTYLVCNALQNSYQLYIYGSATGLSTAELSVPASGRLIGHCRYIGVSDD